MAVEAINAIRRQSSPGSFKPSSPIFHYPTLNPLAVPSPRRNRCISCSDSGNIFDDLDDKDPIPDVIVTKRNRSDSLSGRIFEDVETGTVKYFCRSRGHGFIIPDSISGEELFAHISDIEGEYVPRKGDRVTYRLCPIPPKFLKYQAVHVHILNFTAEEHHKWETPETPEELEEEREIKTLPYDV